MSPLRNALKRIPGTTVVARRARRFCRCLRTRYLQSRFPEGGYLNCHGVEVYCNFANPTYQWYDGKPRNLRLDMQVIEFLVEQGDGDVFIDVGAHFGFFAAYLTQLISARVKPGRLIAIEPDRDNFRCLQRTLARCEADKVSHRLLPAALADKDGIIRLYDNGASCLNSYFAVGGGPAYQIEARSLDSIFDEHGGGGKLNFIKLDIDGPEPLLFEGGRRTLEAHRPNILMEFSPRQLDAFGASPRSFFSYLCSNYHIYWLDYGRNAIVMVSDSDYPMIEANVGGGITDLVLAKLPLDFRAEEWSARAKLMVPRAAA